MRTPSFRDHSSSRKSLVL